MDVSGYSLVGDDESVRVTEALMAVGEALFMISLVEVPRIRIGKGSLDLFLL